VNWHDFACGVAVAWAVFMTFFIARDIYRERRKDRLR
jgi:hypothetical protein